MQLLYLAWQCFMHTVTYSDIPDPK
jgi:hypothetical protein